METELVSSRAEVRTRDPDFPISSRSDPASPSGEVKTATLQASRGTFQSSAAAPPKRRGSSRQWGTAPRAEGPARALLQSSRLPLNFQAFQFPDLREFYRHGVHGWL